LAAAVDDQDIFTRAEILRTLAKLPDPRGAEAIAGVFYIGFGRDVAIQSLTEMGATAEPYVIPLLKDRDQSVRKDAAELLGKIGTDQSIAPLEALEAKESGWTKEAASKAIAAINGRYHP
jgi:HEAT repeat protein